MAIQSIPLKIISTGSNTFVAEVQLGVDGESKFFLLDTGADSTVIDAEYFNQNPQLFEFVRTEDGYDAYGNKIPSVVYKVSQVEVGHLRL